MNRWRSLHAAVAPSLWRCGRALASSGASGAPEHIPVLLHETIALWTAASASKDSPRFFVDGTTGLGGHSRALLLQDPAAQLLCIDRDPEMLAGAKTVLREFGSRVRFQQGSYADIETHLTQSGFPSHVDGILVDLGANSVHFDAGARGFSWQHDGPLDMRFDQQNADTRTAADVVNTFSEVQLTKLFQTYGEERLAKEFAKAIVRHRDERGQLFRTTRDLRECLEAIARKWQTPDSKKRSKKAKATGKSSTHPATKCFQALRICVNDELQHVERGVENLVDRLAPGGRLLTIAFHSLEDRPIKTLFRDLDSKNRQYEDEYDEDDVLDLDDEDDVAESERKRFRMVKRKAVKATDEEIASNPRSRSARLRCLERVH